MIHQINRIRPVEMIFDAIYRHDGWGDGQSLSGTGSNVEQTINIRAMLPQLFQRRHISIILDIPCGDFNWMQHVDLSGVEYRGADIVKPIIASNKMRYGRENISFFPADITRDRLPQVDLILCRDCFVHLSNEQVFGAVRSIIESNSTFLLTTTFPGKSNADIVTGDWRPINLQGEPFLFPSPIELINEGYHDASSGVSDKSLALWRVADLANRFH